MTASVTEKLEMVPMSEIHFDQDFNCRGEIIPMDVVDLAKDIAQNGLLLPVLLSTYSAEQAASTGFKYLLIAGYRRFMAHKINKAVEIKSIIKPEMARVEAQLINLSENLQRKDLNILQEARAIKKLLENGLTEHQASERLGMSRGWVQIRFMLLKLPSDIQDECASGIMNQTQIRDVYTHFQYRGKDAAVEAVKLIKDAKIKSGKSIRLQKTGSEKRKEKEINVKRQRSRQESFEMMSHMQDTIGNGLWTRTLAWVCGEISDLDLYISIKEHDKKFGEGQYIMPHAEAVAAEVAAEVDSESDVA